MSILEGIRKTASYDKGRAKVLAEHGQEAADRMDTFAATLGLGPKYTPKPEVKYVCPKCGGKNAVIREMHADTDMDCMKLQCPDCKYSEEDPVDPKKAE